VSAFLGPSQFASGSLSVSSENAKILNESETTVFAIGGDSEKIAEILAAGTDKVSKINNYLLAGANFSLKSPGAPIGYKAILLCDNSQIAVNSTTDYSIRSCGFVSYKKPLTMNVKQWQFHDVDDDDEDMNFGYSIYFYDQNGNAIPNNVYTNNRGTTYVQEPTKSGVGDRIGNNGNIFFVNEPAITINSPVFKIKFVIRVNTEDSGSAEPWRNNAIWESEMDVSSLPPGTYTIKPWDKMNITFNIN